MRMRSTISLLVFVILKGILRKKFQFSWPLHLSEFPKICIVVFNSSTWYLLANQFQNSEKTSNCLGLLLNSKVLLVTLKVWTIKNRHNIRVKCYNFFNCSCKEFMDSDKSVYTMDLTWNILLISSFDFSM